MRRTQTSYSLPVLRAGLALALVGAVAVLGALALHTSRNPVWLNRYTTGYALALIAAFVLVVGFGIFLVRVWNQPPRLDTLTWRFSPTLLVWISSALGAGASIALFDFLPRFSSIVNSPLFRGGVIAALVGVLMVFYALAESERLPINLVGSALAIWACLLGLGLGGVLGWIVALLGTAQFLLGSDALHAQRVRVRALFATGRGRAALSLLGVALVVGWWVWAYTLNPADSLLDDELLHLAYAATKPLFSSVLHQNFLGVQFYRPGYDVQAAIWFSSFGTNFVNWHLGQSFLLLLSVGLLITALVKLGLRAELAGLLGLLFGSLAAVSLQLNWAVDTTTLLASLVIVVLILLHRPQTKLWWYTGLGLCLVVAPFLKEYGLAVAGAVVVYALEGMRTRFLSRRQGLIISGIALATAAIYFVLRQSVVGGLASTIQNNSGYLFREYSFAELTRLNLWDKLVFHTYTVAAHVVGAFFPVFTGLGVLDFSFAGLAVSMGAGLAILSGAVTSVIRSYSVSTKNDEPLKRTVAGAGVLFVGVGLWMPQILSGTRVPILDLVESLQFLLSLGILFGIWQVLPRDSNDRLLALYAVVLILLVSLLSFSYYQERHQYLSGLAWVILLGLVLKHSVHRAWARALASAPVLMTVLMVVCNSMRAHDAYASPNAGYHFDTTSPLCQPFFPDTLAARLVDQWQLDAAQVAQCRANAVP